ncbi:hypothetical protein O3P69_007248 [Scylla paramamosain]|uniref:Secreted protein n=1 Tax=Scylla paramamosain TaxID=85552 RepID=A0AAW0V6F9_SCYPA
MMNIATLLSFLHLDLHTCRSSRNSPLGITGSSSIKCICDVANNSLSFILLSRFSVSAGSMLCSSGKMVLASGHHHHHNLMDFLQ